ncbi:MAG TPA: multidrug effflux MFS transporter [Povalibacter sp.]|uniref:multidrug effflux MFS transporter n=1 Tax=Povalibacter sp. TaxID=1962978 RepID=UPI002C6E44D2|nr:multidrug effflux MFS transporter [Povalibacter sp.]HMN46860.1 multidrug effflux MFS transporter [Povalibacter sp.]
MTLDSRSHRIPGWLLLVGAMSGVGPFSIDMYLPGFPMIEREFAEQGVERTMAAYLVGITIGQLLYGPISDRFGRKPPLYVGFTLYVLGAMGCAFASDMTMLTLMRVVQALGACGGLVIGRAIIRDRCQPHEAARAFAILMSIVSLGPIVAPTLGGWVITLVGWRGTFVFQAALGVALLIAMHSLLRESRDALNIVPFSTPHVVRTYARLLLDPALVAYSLLGGFAIGALFCYVTGSATVMQELYALTPQQYGWLLGLNGIAFLTASRLNVRALRSMGPAESLSRAIWWPPVVGVLLVASAAFVSLPLWFAIILQFAFFLCTARVTPNVTALGLAPHGKTAGAAAALMGSLQSLVSTLAGMAVAVFNDGTLATLALLMTAGVVLAVVCYFWARRYASGTPGHPDDGMET